MKKVIFKGFSVIIALIILITCTVPVLAVNRDVFIESENINEELELYQSIDIPVNISGNMGIMGFSLLFNYDSDILTPISVSAGAALGKGLFNDSIGATEKGTIKVVWTGSENCYNNGLLFTIKFKVNSTEFMKTKISIKYSQQDTFDESYNDVILNVRDVEVINRSSFIKGDVDGDGSVSIMDATLIQKNLAQIAELNYEQKLIADVDGDKIVSIMDATYIQKYLAQLIDLI